MTDGTLDLDDKDNSTAMGCKFEPFAGDCERKVVEPSGVAAWAREARNKSVMDGD
jgi:hypothetical protein